MATKFEFKNRDGDTLAGALEEPSAPRRGVAVFAHCFTCHKNVHAASRVSKGCRNGLRTTRNTIQIIATRRTFMDFIRDARSPRTRLQISTTRQRSRWRRVGTAAKAGVWRGRSISGRVFTTGTVPTSCYRICSGR